DNAGEVLRELHRYDEALAAHTTARALYEQTGDVDGQAAAWDNAGEVLRELHRYDEALAAHTTARTLYEQTGNNQGQAVVWNNTGAVFRGLHRYDEAVATGRRAAEMLEHLGDFTNTGVAFGELAKSLDLAGSTPTVVRETWLRSASAYDTAGATQKADQSRASADNGV
ncbi:tetratricopeptide repeat protein, partial [Streptomyces puniciscabiei]